jgi:hypothetical protein
MITAGTAGLAADCKWERGEPRNLAEAGGAGGGGARGAVLSRDKDFFVSRMHRRGGCMRGRVL